MGMALIAWLKLLFMIIQHEVGAVNYVLYIKLDMLFFIPSLEAHVVYILFSCNSL